MNLEILAGMRMGVRLKSRWGRQLPTDMEIQPQGSIRMEILAPISPAIPPSMSTEIPSMGILEEEISLTIHRAISMGMRVAMDMATHRLARIGAATRP
jgi:hypothetical protein